MACGILPDQGSNSCLLHWQVDSLSLSHPFAVHWLSLVVASGGYSLVEVQELLIVVVSLVEQYRLQGVWASVVVACWVSSWGWRPPELRLISCGMWA